VVEENELCETGLPKGHALVRSVTVDQSKYFLIQGPLSEIEEVIYSITNGKADEAYRLMDRVHFLKNQQSLHNCGIAFFSMAAHEYDSMVSVTRNTKCAEELLKIGKISLLNIALKTVLDYGSGTSVSSLAIVSNEYEVIAYDRSPEMCEIAKIRFPSVVNSLSECKNGNFQLVIACYVMHFGLNDAEAIELSRIVPPGGVIAANFHKTLNVEEVCEVLKKVGFSMIDCRENDCVDFGPIMIFRRNE
jgi:ubiquinone/menaquinone biosynthesis C-methylase UbiE